MSDDTYFAEGPVRDERFDVKERWSELVNVPHDHPDHQIEFLHRQMNEEVNSIEMTARNIADFPDADWELRLELARQCWDEARHCLAFRRLYESRGGKVGQFPIINFQYRIVTKIPTLLGRLAVQNRSFEAAGIDAIDHELRNFDREADAEYAALFEMQLADEMQHVRFGNEWIYKLIKQGGPRATFEVSRSVSQASEAFALIADSDSKVQYPIADGVRKEAGFTESDIAGAHKLASDYAGRS